MFGHRGFQPVIDAIIKLAEKAAKEPWNFQPPDASKYKDKVAVRWSRPTCARRLRRPRSRSATSWSTRASAKVKELLPADADASEKVLLALASSRGSSRMSCAATSSRRRSASTAAT